VLVVDALLATAEQRGTAQVLEALERRARFAVGGTVDGRSAGAAGVDAGIEAVGAAAGAGFATG